MIIKKIYRKIRYKEKRSSESYIKFLRDKGIFIGENCRFFDPISNIIDIQNPYMITIGNNVKITSKVIILTHDYSWSVLSNLKGEILGGVGKVDIGNNVFVGMGTIILKNTEIGDNVIIGAGSIVSGKIESDSVYAGNPARKIMDIEKFYEKRKARQIREAMEIVKQIEMREKRRPRKEELLEYFWIFERQELSIEQKEQIKRVGEEEYILSKFYSNDRDVYFKTFEDFLEFCENKFKGAN